MSKVQLGAGANSSAVKAHVKKKRAVKLGDSVIPPVLAAHLAKKEAKQVNMDAGYASPGVMQQLVKAR